MKSHKIKVAFLIMLAGGVVAWSPGSSEDLFIGAGNTILSTLGVSGAVGNNNDISAKSSLVVGEQNQVTPGATSTYTLRTLVSGEVNSVKASNSLVAGYNNTVTGKPNTTLATHSAAIGANNQIQGFAWAMGNSNTVTGLASASIGSSNTVSGDYGYALGGGLNVNQGGVTAIGAWNSDPVAGDAVVVGAGNSSARSTALRITYGGGVILGRAQGDIAMGDYQ